jgi:DNA-binding CsgD family transcriptional regulator/tetratricopeptide (TPR) repeat protein
LRRADEPWWACRALNDLGIVALQRGDYGSAEAYLYEGLAAARTSSDQVNEAAALCDLGRLAYLRREYRDAVARCEEGLGVASARGDDWLTGVLLTDLGYALCQQGDLTRSRKTLEDAVKLQRQLGDWDGLARALTGTGLVAIAEHRYQDAQAALSEGLRLRQEVGDQPAMAESLEGLAELAAAIGEADRALHLLGASDAVRNKIGAALSPNGRAMRDGWLIPIQRVRGRTAVARELMAGQAAPIDRLVSLELAAVTTPLGKASPKGPDNLTPREREVARLIGKGLTNRQIAESLVVSERTAEWHVGHILAKTGMTNRSQLVAWTAQQ